MDESSSEEIYLPLEDSLALLDKVQSYLEDMEEFAKRAADPACPPEERIELQGHLVVLRNAMDRTVEEYQRKAVGQ